MTGWPCRPCAPPPIKSLGDPGALLSPEVLVAAVAVLGPVRIAPRSNTWRVAPSGRGPRRPRELGAGPAPLDGQSAPLLHSAGRTAADALFCLTKPPLPSGPPRAAIPPDRDGGPREMAKVARIARGSGAPGLETGRAGEGTSPRRPTVVPCEALRGTAKLACVARVRPHRPATENFHEKRGHYSLLRIPSPSSPPRRPGLAGWGGSQMSSIASPLSQ